MSAISLILLCAAATATALGGAALHTARGLRHELKDLRAQLDAGRGTVATGHHQVPGARDAGHTSAAHESHTEVCAERIRSAVADALADERERELAEARAFWAAQEARDAGPGSGALLAGHGTEYEVAQGELADQLDALIEAQGLDPHDTGEVFIPRQAGPEDGDVELPETFAALEALEAAEAEEPGTPLAPPAATAPAEPEDTADTTGPAAAERPAAAPEAPPESPGLAAARRRHPSQPDFTLSGDPVVPSPAPSTAPTVADHERTVERLAELAGARTPLADVRPGPLGTLDVYVFEDGTTVCLSPGHRATSEALSDALRLGEAPVLMGGSGIAGSYALTFGLPNGETAYLLADRVIASL